MNETYLLQLIRYKKDIVSSAAAIDLGTIMQITAVQT